MFEGLFDFIDKIIGFFGNLWEKDILQIIALISIGLLFITSLIIAVFLLKGSPFDEPEEISLEDGKRISKEILRKIGFTDIKFEIKKATSKYYAPETEFEVFIKHNNEWLEIGDGGFYSPVSLANFNILYPVFNLGLGIERLCMIETGMSDIRELVYPYF